MLMRLDLALMTEAVGRMVAGEAAGLVEEDRENTELPVIIYILEMCSNKPGCCSFACLAILLYNYGWLA